MTPKIGLIANIEKDLRVNMHGAYGLSIEKSGGLPLVLPYKESEEITCLNIPYTYLTILITSYYIAIVRAKHCRRYKTTITIKIM